ncbi:hypothetical protein Q7C36_015732 [Tachysurus vachellii]|uniref:Uncharacterized protein n=1 Tax=Tachysurus vachellii TaxID=175792 RepID=A0AA88M7F4_TACVA|nr:hypothetical protein Q7C36_015732 [Tachysurus vachellii]
MNSRAPLATAAATSIVQAFIRLLHIGGDNRAIPSHLAAIPQAIDGTLGRGMAQTSTFSSSTGVRPSVRLPSKKRHPEFNLSCSGGSRQELVYHISSSDNALAMRDWKLAPCIKLI